MASGPNTVCFDFDGVIHSYISPFDLTNIPDHPNADAMILIAMLRANGYKVVVNSSRCVTSEGVELVKDYLKKYNIVVDEVSNVKPIAFCYVDDRAMLYTPKKTPQEIEAFYKEIISFKSWGDKVKGKIT